VKTFCDEVDWMLCNPIGSAARSIFLIEQKQKRWCGAPFFCFFLLLFSCTLHDDLFNLDGVAAVVNKTDLPVACERLDGPAVVVARLVLAIFEGIILQIIA